MAQNSTLSVIIVNYNNWADTIECLESLIHIRLQDYQIIVVDNHSADNSVHHLTQWASGNLCNWTPPHFSLNYLTVPPAEKPIPYQVFRCQEKISKAGDSFRVHPEYPADTPTKKLRLVIISADRNGGFAAGNNIGIRYAMRQGCRYFLLLNNDTVVTPDFLSPLLQAIQEDPSIGMVGGKILNYREPHLIWAAGGGQITRWTSGMRHIGVNQSDSADYARRFDCDYITGCLLLVKKEVIDAIGLMKEEYFLYYEETDWNLRAEKAGFRRVYVPEAVIYHKASVSLSQQSILFTYYYTRNRIFLVRQNYHGVQKAVTLAYLAGYNLIRILANLVRLKLPKVRIIILATYHGWRGRMGIFPGNSDRQ